ncbi:MULTISPECIES: type I restriction-modification system subunit M [Chryseobacterium]|uniref:type I restriction-modification system subunit M n=1 Tax=Chryseobacterium TaxID=59732 RepID=UPI00195EF6E9|nr:MULTISPECIES: type I restriction-modification system subunit M [Chryseobacterium]MBM7420463.1 type I restriction enzyme M protein [Chryseobacterium sp. JUb44]MDH6210412.1 type I restriction enzyme M protein [Chryseobacterium sp. BIGb0186]WSO09113.1 N-6 DNA methylase [Chryseobacterium scophthalmum]
MLQNNPILKALIDRLWNNFWSGGISNPLTAIEQITYLIFMKQMDDLEAKREHDAKSKGEAYTSKFDGMFKVPGSDEEISKQDLRWKTFSKSMSSEALLYHVQTKVFPFLKEFEGGSKFTKAMANAVFIMPKSSLLVEAIKIIEEIFVEIEKDAVHGGHAFQDIQGDVYEMLLGEIASAGKNGQFRTPRHIIKLMNDLVQPQLGQRIADPACGTAGFLLGAYQYILTDLVRKESPNALQPDEDGFMRATVSATLNENLKHIVEESLYGYDIDTTMVRLGLMNLMMHGIEQPNIDYKDTLSKSYNEDAQFDIVLANPPFTGNIDKGDINESLKLGTTKTELLFIERIHTMLKVGGTAAIVVPQGVLFGAGKAFLECRKIMLEKSELKAVITMPSGVFKPYAGVSTAILIFTKGSTTDTVWFYDMQNDGYTLDDKRNKSDKSDLQDIVKQYHQKTSTASTEQEREGFNFSIAIKEIIDNGYDLSFSKYKIEVYEEETFEDPKVIFEKLESIEVTILKGISELKELIQ